MQLKTTFVKLIELLHTNDKNNTDNKKDLLDYQTFKSMYRKELLSPISINDTQYKQHFNSAYSEAIKYYYLDATKLCKINNNLLGMTVPSKRETTALNNKGFAKYENWFSSILDYKLYQDFVFSHKNITNKKQYIAYLHKNYAKSPTYKNKLTNLSNKYELRNSYNIMFYTNL